MTPIAAIVIAALSLGSVTSGRDKLNKQVGDQAARDAIRLMIGGGSMKLSIDHGAVTVRHGVLSPATDDLSNAALVRLYVACKSSWVGAILLSLPGASPQPETIRDKEGERLAPSMITVTDFLENKILVRARMEDRLIWSPQQREEQVKKAVVRISGMTE
jgi:hypothetical protein